MESAEQYTKSCKDLATEALNALHELSTKMKDAGDETRAMDVDEAIGYIKASIEEV